jgi:hypothetical protein
MSISDKQLLGLRGELAEMDRQEAARMYPLNTKDGLTPYRLDCPLDAIEDVARGLAEGTIKFFFRKYLIKVGDWEWSLDGDLALWRKARAYAASLSSQGLLGPPLELFTPSWAPHGCEYSRA